MKAKGSCGATSIASVSCSAASSNRPLSASTRARRRLDAARWGERASRTPELPLRLLWSSLENQRVGQVVLTLVGTPGRAAGAAICGQGFLRAPLLFQSEGEVGPRSRHDGVETYCPLQASGAFRETTAAQIDDAEVVVRVGAARVELRDFEKDRYRFGVSVRIP